MKDPEGQPKVSVHWGVFEGPHNQEEGVQNMPVSKRVAVRANFSIEGNPGGPWSKSRGSVEVYVLMGCHTVMVQPTREFGNAIETKEHKKAITKMLHKGLELGTILFKRSFLGTNKHEKVEVYP